MRIAIIAENCNLTGAANIATRLHSTFCENKTHESLFIYALPRSTTRSLPNSVRFGNLDYRFACMQSIAMLPSLLKDNFCFRESVYKTLDQDFDQLMTLLRQYKPDVVNLHNVGRILRHWHVCALSEEFRVFWTMHDRYPIFLYHNEYINYAGNIRRTYEPMWADLPPFAPPAGRDELVRLGRTTFISPSQWLKSESENELSGQKPKIAQLNNPVFSADSSPTKPPAAINSLVAQIRAQYRFLLLFVGAPCYDLKNYDILASTYFHYPRELADTAVLVAGPYMWGRVRSYNEIQDHIQRHASQVKALPRDFALPKHPLYSKQVFFLGGGYTSEEMNWFYQQADVTVVASCVENQSSVTLESYANGTPVIASRVGGNPELVPDELLFDHRSPQQLIHTLTHLRSTLDSSFSPPVDLDCFTLSRQADAYCDLFQSGALH